MYTFDTAGTYTVWAEIYDINGWQNGWNADNRFDQRTESITVREPVTVQFSPASYTVDEDDGGVDITLTMSESLDSAMSVLMRSADGTAVRGQDYRSISTLIRFPPNTTSQTTSVTIYDDRVMEAIRETFTVWLQSSSDTRIRVETTPAVISIQDNDEVEVGLEASNYYVRAVEGASVDLCVVENRSTLIGIPIAVYFSYTDPDGAVSSVSPSSVYFEVGDRRKCVNVVINEVDETAEVVFTLDRASDSRVLFGRTTATITVRPASPPGTVGVTVTSNWLGRTVTVDGTNRSAPYTATWNSGSSHTLDVPSPQTVSGGRYVFSSGATAAPGARRCRRPATRPTTANFTYQPDPTGHRPAAVGVSPLPPFPQDVSLISGSPKRSWQAQAIRTAHFQVGVVCR